MKVCPRCKVEKAESEFFNSSSRPDGLTFYCKLCEKQKRKKRSKAANQQSYQKNKERVKEQGRKWRAKPGVKEHRAAHAKEYRSREDVKKHIREHNTEYARTRYEEDPVFRMKAVVRSAVRSAFSKQDLSKNGTSTWSKLPYTPEDLKAHLERQFEPWMCWENYGVYEEGKLKWNIDHIVSQSALPFDSMDHPNFLKCWALENLRPLEFMENLQKSNKPIAAEISLSPERAEGASQPLR